jgi:putative sterol carrier protein
MDLSDSTWKAVVEKLDAMEGALLKELRAEEEHAKVRYIQGQLAAITKVRSIPTMVQTNREIENQQKKVS